MNISSVVLRSLPRHQPQLLTELVQLPGVEVHAQDDNGRLVLTIEDGSTQSASETYVRLHDLSGVLSVSLVYQYSDDDATETSHDVAPQIQEETTK